MGRLDDKVALVTGGGRGIGRGIALAMAKEGARVAVAEIDADTAKETGEELTSLGARALAIPSDVGTRADCEAAVARTVAELGGLDVLVNNAAWASTIPKPLLEVDDAQFERTLVTNLWATFWTMQAGQPHMVQRGGGSIVNFGSNSGTLGLEGQGPYAAAKEGIRGLTRVAAREWGPERIRVNVICPFANSPGMLAWAAQDPDAYESRLAAIPLRRIGDCEDDIARVAVFLASDDAAYVTGQTMFVDGGAGSVR